MDTQKIIVYIDGFNFYYGLKKNPRWRRYYWLDVVKFFETFMRPSQELLCINYFSARPHNTEKALRQNAFFQANKENPKFNLFLGKYLHKSIQCYNCGYMIQTYEEKESDVRIATQIVNDANNHLCDVAIVVSAESPETEAPVSDTNTLIAAVERNLAKMDALNTDYSLFRGITCGVLSSTTPAYGHPFYIEGELSAARAAGGRASPPQSPYCGVTLCRLVRG